MFKRTLVSILLLAGTCLQPSFGAQTQSAQQLLNKLGTAAAPSDQTYRDDEYLEAAEALKHVPVAQIRVSLSTIAHNKALSPVQRLFAIDCLFAGKDFSCANMVRDLVIKPPPVGEPFSHGNWVPNINYGALVRRTPAIRKWMIDQPGFVTEMIGTLHAHDIKLRRQAACVLSEIATPAVVQPLFQFALNENDEEMRFYASVGLACATGIVAEPMDGNFQRRSDQYVAFWKRWFSYKPKSNSPLTVAKLSDPHPPAKYTDELLFLESTSNDLQEFIRDSELIVVGTIDRNGIGSKSRPSGTRAKAKYYSLKIDRIIKDTAKQNPKAAIVRLDYGSQWDYGVFFLTRSKNGTCEPARQAFPRMLQAIPTINAKTASAPIDKVIDEQNAILITPHEQLIPRQAIKETHAKTAAAVASFGTAEGVSSAVVVRNSTPVQHHYDCTVTDAIYAIAATELKQLPRERVIKVLHSSIEAPNLSVESKLWIVNVLYSFGDFDSLSMVKRMLLSPRNLSEESECAIRALAKTIEGKALTDKPFVDFTAAEKDRAKRQVSTMIELLHSTSVTVRRAAAQCLSSATKTNDVRRVPKQFADPIVDPLIKIGLFDPDMLVRYYAVCGLRSATRLNIGTHCDEEDEFERNQAVCVGAWRRWADLRPITLP